MLPGLRPMTAERYFAALEIALAADRPQLRLPTRTGASGMVHAALLSLLLPQKRADSPVIDDGGILRALESAAPARQRRILLDYLRAQVSSLLGLDGSGPYIDEHQPLLRLGMDSLMALEFRNQLASAFRRPLSATLVFDHPTLDNLAAFLNGSSAPDGRPPQPDAALEELEALSESQAEELLKAELYRD